MTSQKRREGESFDSMFKRFKRDVKRNGVLLELKDKKYYEKPSERKKKEKKAAQQRTRMQQKADELS